MEPLMASLVTMFAGVAGVGLVVWVAAAMTAGDDLSGPQRVARARDLKGASAQALAKKAGLPSPISQIYFRAFKEERILEAWGRADSESKWKKLGSWPIAGISGELGPKRREGDRQVPEGFYVIDRFNPQSRFRLSLGINYPNASDRVRSDKEKPGGDIFIHGDTKSIGCLAMTDDVIDLLYLLALDAKAAGQRQIPVHIFPFRMTGQRMKHARGELVPFWRELAGMFSHFEAHRQLPKWTVDAKTGAYRITD